MNAPFSNRRGQFVAALALLAAVTTGPAAETNPAAYPIDLPTVLRLAGAQNLDVQIARERVREAQANHEQARALFLPWIAPGLGYRRHDGNIQDVSGNVFDANKQSYTVGAALTAQVDLGDAIYRSLAAQQLARASAEAAEAQRQETLFTAAAGYFDLARAQAAGGAARDALRVTEDYAAQVRQAVAAGLAFQGETYRVDVQAEKNRRLVRQTTEERQVAAARLAQTLRLPPATDLVPQEAELAPLTLVDTNAALDTLVTRALANRPELRQFASLRDAAQASRKGATTGPWIPTVGAQVFYGGLGGGRGGAWGNFDDSFDAGVGLSWRIGPGGLFDRGRIHAAEARQEVSVLQLEKTRDDVVRQVIEARTRAQSQQDQIASAQRAVAAAEALLRLSQERKAFGVGAVLETLTAEQELTRARLDYVNLLAAHNQAQWALQRALGAVGVSSAPVPATVRP